MPVYLVQAGNDGPVKIGHGRDPLKRLHSIQIGSVEPLRLLGTLPGSVAKEAELHSRFAADHIRGEWFRFNPAMLDGLEPPVAPRSVTVERRRSRSALDRYLEDRGMTRTSFAERVGVSQSMITLLCNGTCWPGRRLAEAIFRETGGAVGPHDFFPEPPKADSSSVVPCPSI